MDTFVGNLRETWRVWLLAGMWLSFVDAGSSLFAYLAEFILSAWIAEIIFLITKRLLGTTTRND